LRTFHTHKRGVDPACCSAFLIIVVIVCVSGEICVLGAKHLVKGQFVLVDLGWDCGFGVEALVRKSGCIKLGMVTVLVMGSCERKKVERWRD